MMLWQRQQFVHQTWILLFCTVALLLEIVTWQELDFQTLSLPAPHISYEYFMKTT